MTCRCPHCGDSGPHSDVMPTDTDYVVVTCAACGKDFGAELREGRYMSSSEAADREDAGEKQ